MYNLLYSIYTSGYPNKNVGGPNHIIYNLIKNNIHNNYNINYLSYDSFLSQLDKHNIDQIKNPYVFRKKLTNQFYSKFNWYRKLVRNDFYLPFHLNKKEKRFTSFAESVQKYNIIHSKDSISLAFLTNKNIKAKKIVSIHSNGPLSKEIIEDVKNLKLKYNIGKKIQELEKRTINQADIITFPSKAAKEIFIKDSNFKIDRQKIRIIYNGVDIDYINKIKDYNNILKELGINKKYDLVLLNISTFRKVRRLDILFSAIDKLKKTYKKNVLLINIGDGHKNKKLVNLVKQMGLEENIKLLSGIQNEDIIRLLKVSNAFIMTTERVIFDLVVLEALACGTCCVVSNDGGNKEIIKDGENGFLIDIDDVDKIAKKIISILPFKDNIKENAIKTAQQFTVEKMVNEYFQLYESML